MTDNKKTENDIGEQVQQLITRIDKIENEVHKNHINDGNSTEVILAECCGLPSTPVRQLEPGIDPGRESLIRSIEKKWANGTELKFFFFREGVWGGSDEQQEIVRNAFNEWKDIGIGLSFTEVATAAQADIRIGFKRGEGAWSYVGRDIWSRPIAERTMNFGWTLRGQSGRDTALHEIGHTLGFQHEQQNPFAGIEWDENAVYRYFMGPPNNWSKEKTYHNVLRTLDPNTVEGTGWDPDSIMQYSIRSGLIVKPERFKSGLNPAPGLSDHDISRVRAFYPELTQKPRELKQFESEKLNIAPAEQVNYIIKPPLTRKYNIQIFGISDAVMVLFEDNNGSLEHIAADDDSGFDRNSSLNVRLVQGREYTLRIRLYFNGDIGDVAVMLW